MSPADRPGLPTRVAPMLAIPGPVPSGSGWSYELKMDGIRAVIRTGGTDVVVHSRAGHDITTGYPHRQESR